MRTSAGFDRESTGSRHSTTTTRRIGLVLGGGGVVGLAYHAGALAALEHDLGWDARQAEVIAGTSVGALVGLLLRLGIPASDLSAMMVGASILGTTPALADYLRNRPELPSIDLRGLLVSCHALRPGALVRLARRPWRIDPGVLLACLAAPGRFDLYQHLQFLDDQSHAAWPPGELLVAAVRQRDLALRVLTAADPISPARAVAASAAVPGHFAPVRFQGDWFVDGGVRSATNADVLRDHLGLDLVVIVAPTAGAASHAGVQGWVRGHARRALAHERRVLDRAGIPSIVIEPGPAVVAEMGLDLMSDARVREITREAFLDTGRQLVGAGPRSLLAA